MKRILMLISLFSLLLIGADRPVDAVRFTVVNKSGMEISISLLAQDAECASSKDIIRGEFYYLTVLEGDRSVPATKAFDIQRDTYVMQLYYNETYDPVYGYKCGTPAPNALLARNNTRLVVLPCDFTPGGKAVGERTMWKYLPYPVKANALFFQKYWLTRLVN